MNFLNIKKEISETLLKNNLIVKRNDFGFRVAPKVKYNDSILTREEKEEFYKNLIDELDPSYVDIFPTLMDFIRCFNNNIDRPPVCPYCDNLCKLQSPANINRNNGYLYTCGSKECINLQNGDFLREFCFTEEANLKRQQTVEKVYGVKNISQSEIIKKKKIETSFKNWGTTSPTKSDEIKKKTAQTCRKKYGGPAPTCSFEVLSKAMKTNIEKRGVPWPTMSPEIKEKVHCSLLKFQEKLKEERSSFSKNEYLTLYNNIYYYDDNFFDSSWEVIFYIYRKEILGDSIERLPHKILYIDSHGIQHFYFPDFKIGDKLFEIKNNKLILWDENGNPVDFISIKGEHSDQLSSKFKCLIDNNVNIISENEIKILKKEVLLYLRNTKDISYRKFLNSIKLYKKSKEIYL